MFSYFHSFFKSVIVRNVLFLNCFKNIHDWSRTRTIKLLSADLLDTIHCGDWITHNFDTVNERILIFVSHIFFKKKLYWRDDAFIRISHKNFVLITSWKYMHEKNNKRFYLGWKHKLFRRIQKWIIFKKETIFI